MIFCSQFKHFTKKISAVSFTLTFKIDHCRMRHISVLKQICLKCPHYIPGLRILTQFQSCPRRRNSFGSYLKSDQSPVQVLTVPDVA